jgi:anti-sigma-K factor RskA
MTGHESDHDRLHESSGLYVLGMLDRAERAAFEAHAATCAACTAELRTLASVAAALPHAATQVDPPPSLRARVLTAATGEDRSARENVTAFAPRAAPPPLSAATPWWWMSAAAMALIAVGAASYALSLRGQISGLRTELASTNAELATTVERLARSEAQLAVATRSVTTAEARMVVLTAPDMRQVNLAGQPVAPRASGRAFLSRARGLVFTANDLPPLPPGRGYQLWVVTPTAPVSIGMVQVDNTGRAAQAFTTPEFQGPVAAVAVTIEPEAGVPAPTGDKYLVGTTE